MARLHGSAHCPVCGGEVSFVIHVKSARKVGMRLWVKFERVDTPHDCVVDADA